MSDFSKIQSIQLYKPQFYALFMHLGKVYKPYSQKKNTGIQAKRMQVLTWKVFGKVE